MNIKILSLDYHRNGVAGTGFYVAIFEHINPSERMMQGKFVGTVFPDRGSTSVYKLTGKYGLHNNEIRFGYNSWRGDHYEDELRDAIKRYENKEFGNSDFGVNI